MAAGSNQHMISRRFFFTGTTKSCTQNRSEALDVDTFVNNQYRKSTKTVDAYLRKVTVKKTSFKPILIENIQHNSLQISPQFL